jgi:general nucleoside transport system permease protein
MGNRQKAGGIVRSILSLGIIYSSVRLAVPLLLAAIGGLFSERSGVINIALEGLMLAGAFTSATVTYYSGNPWIGLAAAIAAGIFVALLHAVACISFRADQVVTGTAINILMLGVPTLLNSALFQTTGSTPGLPQSSLIPNAPVVIAFGLVPAVWYVLYRTPFGLRLRAVGENPEAADTAGVNVTYIRYVAVMASGALAAIGGAYLSIGQSSLFIRNMTAGRGYIALAALIFGKWRPVQTMLACLLFGFAEAVSIQMQGVIPYIRVEYIQIIPYVLTVVVLAGFIGAARAPKALGQPYSKDR